MQALDDFANFIGLIGLVVIICGVLHWLGPYFDMIGDAFMYVWGGIVTPVYETVKGWFE